MAIPLSIERIPEPGADGYIRRMCEVFQVGSAGRVMRAESLPFSLNDATAGSESTPAEAR